MGEDVGDKNRNIRNQRVRGRAGRRNKSVATDWCVFYRVTPRDRRDIANILCRKHTSSNQKKALCVTTFNDQALLLVCVHILQRLRLIDVSDDVHLPPLRSSLSSAPRHINRHNNNNNNNFIWSIKTWKYIMHSEGPQLKHHIHNTIKQTNGCP